MDWSLEPIFGSYVLVVGIAIVFLFFLIVLRESGRVTRWQSIALWTIRLLMCLVVLLVLLKPGLTFTRQTTPRGTIAVMIDATTSMLLPSGDTQGTRWDSARDIWKAIWDQREAFGKDASLVPFVFDSALKPLAAGDATNAAKLPDKPEGVSTDIGGPLSQLMSAPLDSPLSAVIWMGDGAQTHSPSGGDPQQIARRLAQIDVPLYIIGVGPRSDSENAQDLSVEEVPEQLDVFTKNPLNVRGLLRCRGVANRELLVKLLMIQPGKPAKELSIDRVKPTKSDQSLPFRLSVLAPGEPGAYELAVRAEPVTGEAVVENNEATVYLNVRGGGSRILYIEGEPRPEMNFIRRAMSESSDMQMVTVWVGKPPVEKWPYDLSQQLSDGVYDCIVLGDVDYRAIDAIGAKTIADQVKKGAGLVTLGGYFAYGAGGWDKSPLQEILPVIIAGQERQELNKPIILKNHLAGPIQVVPVGAYEIMQIDSAEQNEVTWASLKPLQGASRWEGVKKGSILLAQTAQKQPLIVSGSADQGRVVSIAFDSTYLWWRQGKSAEHKAFWRKIIYWCMRREATEEGIQMNMPKRRLLLTQPSEMVLQWNGGTDQAKMPEKIRLNLWKTANTATATDPGLAKPVDLGEVQLLKRDAQSMRATFAGSKEGGRYEWRASVTGSLGQKIEAKLPFVVVEQSLETLQMPDWQLLSQMAKLNASAGGTLVAPDQTDEIVRQILERRKQSTQTAIENRKLGDGVLDTWTAFLLIALLMVGQWGLRKKWSLP